LSRRIQVYNANVNIRKALMQQDDYVPAEKQMVDWHVSRVEFPANGILIDHKDYVEHSKYTIINLDKCFYIICCNSLRNNNAILYLEDKATHAYLIRKTIHELQEALLLNGFIRIHDSYIVNELYVKWVEYPHWLWLGEYKLPIGYSYLADFKKQFSPVTSFNGGKPHRKAA